MTTISRDDAEEYTEALGQVVAGSYRQIALAQRLGVPKALGLTLRQWVGDRLGGYIALSIAERREAVLELTAPPEEGGQGLSQKEAADVLGVSAMTVSRDLQPPLTDVSEQSVDEPEIEPANPTPITNVTDGPHPTQDDPWAEGSPNVDDFAPPLEPEPASVPGPELEAVLERTRKANEEALREKYQREAILQRSAFFDQTMDFLAEFGQWPDRVDELWAEYQPLYPTNPITDDKLDLAAAGFEAIRKARS